MIPSVDIENWFTHHNPRPGQSDVYTRLRNEAKQLAHTINGLVPDCADKTHSIRMLRDALMWANCAVACYSSPRAARPEIQEQAEHDEQQDEELRKR